MDRELIHRIALHNAQIRIVKPKLDKKALKIIENMQEIIDKLILINKK